MDTQTQIHIFHTAYPNLSVPLLLLLLFLPPVLWKPNRYSVSENIQQSAHTLQGGCAAAERRSDLGRRPHFSEPGSNDRPHRPCLYTIWFFTRPSTMH